VDEAFLDPVRLLSEESFSFLFILSLSGVQLLVQLLSSAWLF
jgi:hypothetical protein